MDLTTKVLKLNDEDVILQIWDTAGQERFHSITFNLYKDSDGIIVAFDLTDRETFKTVTYWIKNIEETMSQKDIPIVIIGTKSDLLDKIQV